jgi:hypothetical protein
VEGDFDSPGHARHCHPDITGVVASGVRGIVAVVYVQVIQNTVVTTHETAITFDNEVIMIAI